jgi:hypothetical protein
VSDVADLYYSRDGDFFEEYGSTEWPSRGQRNRDPRPEDTEDDDE